MNLPEASKSLLRASMLQYHPMPRYRPSLSSCNAVGPVMTSRGAWVSVIFPENATGCNPTRGTSVSLRTGVCIIFIFFSGGKLLQSFSILVYFLLSTLLIIANFQIIIPGKKDIKRLSLAVNCRVIVKIQKVIYLRTGHKAGKLMQMEAAL